MTKHIWVAAVVALTGLVAVASAAGATGLPAEAHDQAVAHTHADGKWLDRGPNVSAETSWTGDWAAWSPEEWDGKSFSSDQPDLPGRVGDPQFHFIYLYGRDGENRFGKLAAMFQADALQASQHLEVLGRGLRLDLRTGPCFDDDEDGVRESCVDITVVKAKQTTGQLTKGGFGAVSKEVSGFKAPNKKYAVWLDAPYYKACGQGESYRDPDRDASNSNEGRTLSVVYQAWQPDSEFPRDHELNAGFCRGRTLLHELAHNMGAVQDAAPNAYGGHCDDLPEDIMCYQPAGYSGTFTDNQVFDYNKDDYWDPIAVAGSGSQQKLGWWTVNLSKYVCPAPTACDQPNTPEY